MENLYTGIKNNDMNPNRRPDSLKGIIIISMRRCGHAMLIIDMAEDDKGHQVYMLAQSYMPAQDIHIVKDPSSADGNPWYPAGSKKIITPDWTFYAFQLHHWQEIINNN